MEHFEVAVTTNGNVGIYWGCQADSREAPCTGALMWEGPIAVAKELQKMLEVIIWHGEYSPSLQMRLTVEQE